MQLLTSTAILVACIFTTLQCPFNIHGQRIQTNIATEDNNDGTGIPWYRFNTENLYSGTSNYTYNPIHSLPREHEAILQSRSREKQQSTTGKRIQHYDNPNRPTIYDTREHKRNENPFTNRQNSNFASYHSLQPVDLKMAAQFEDTNEGDSMPKWSNTRRLDMNEQAEAYRLLENYYKRKIGPQKGTKGGRLPFNPTIPEEFRPHTSTQFMVPVTSVQDDETEHNLPQLKVNGAKGNRQPYKPTIPLEFYTTTDNAAVDRKGVNGVKGGKRPFHPIIPHEYSSTTESTITDEEHKKIQIVKGVKGGRQPFNPTIPNEFSSTTEVTMTDHTEKTEKFIKGKGVKGGKHPFNPTIPNELTSTTESIITMTDYTEETEKFIKGKGVKGGRQPFNPTIPNELTSTTESIVTVTDHTEETEIFIKGKGVKGGKQPFNPTIPNEFSSTTESIITMTDYTEETEKFIKEKGVKGGRQPFNPTVPKEFYLTTKSMGITEDYKKDVRTPEIITNIEPVYPEIEATIIPHNPETEVAVSSSHETEILINYSTTESQYDYKQTEEYKYPGHQATTPADTPYSTIKSKGIKGVKGGKRPFFPTVPREFYPTTPETVIITNPAYSITQQTTVGEHHEDQHTTVPYIEDQRTTYLKYPETETTTIHDITETTTSEFSTAPNQEHQYTTHPNYPGIDITTHNIPETTAPYYDHQYTTHEILETTVGEVSTAPNYYDQYTTKPNYPGLEIATTHSIPENTAPNYNHQYTTKPNYPGLEIATTHSIPETTAPNYDHQYTTHEILETTVGEVSTAANYDDQYTTKPNYPGLEIATTHSISETTAPNYDHQYTTKPNYPGLEIATTHSIPETTAPNYDHQYTTHEILGTTVGESSTAPNYDDQYTTKLHYPGLEIATTHIIPETTAPNYDDQYTTKPNYPGLEIATTRSTRIPETKAPNYYHQYTAHEILETTIGEVSTATNYDDHYTTKPNYPGLEITTTHEIPETTVSVDTTKSYEEQYTTKPYYHGIEVATTHSIPETTAPNYDHQYTTHEIPETTVGEVSTAPNYDDQFTTKPNYPGLEIATTHSIPETAAPNHDYQYTTHASPEITVSVGTTKSYYDGQYTIKPHYPLIETSEDIYQVTQVISDLDFIAGPDTVAYPPIEIEQPPIPVIHHYNNKEQTNADEEDSEQRLVSLTADDYIDFRNTDTISKNPDQTIKLYNNGTGKANQPVYSYTVANNVRTPTVLIPVQPKQSTPLVITPGRGDLPAVALQDENTSDIPYSSLDVQRDIKGHIPYAENRPDIKGRGGTTASQTLKPWYYLVTSKLT